MNDDRVDRWTAALLLAAALVVRIWDIAGTEHYVGDQNTVVLAAYRFPETGLFAPDSWEQPPFHYYLIRLGTLLFGDNAYGWRMKNVLLGGLTVPLLFLLGRALFADRRIALLASLFLLFDPLHLYYSRTIYAEISSLPFFLAAMLLMVRRDDGPTGAWAGILLGCALAQKWYYLVPSLVLIVVVLRQRTEGSGTFGRELLPAAARYGIVPLTVYLLAFAPWFQRGYSLPEFFAMQVDAYHYLQSMEFYDSAMAFFRPDVHPSWTWFLRPVVLGNPIDREGAWGRFLVIMNNIPVWGLTMPAMLHLAVRSFRQRALLPSLPVILFLAFALPFAAVERPVFLYSAIVLLPFAFLASADLVVSLLDALGATARGFRSIAAGYAAWGLYLVPLILGQPVPLVLYAPFFPLFAPP